MATDDKTTENPATSGTPDKPGTIGHYLELIERYEKGTSEWKERCEKIIKIYLDQHRTNASPRRFALLWSNIETLKPAIYARLPIAVVSRRYKDKDEAGRRAAEVLERCINTSFDLYGIDAVLRLVRDDRLLTSRGQAWVRYEADIDEDGGEENDEEEPKGNDKAPARQPSPRIKYEKVCCDHVHWMDFGHSMHRTWPEVTTVWRRVYMTREKVRKRWGKTKADKLEYEVRQDHQMGSSTSKDELEPQAMVHEIWDKEKRQAIWLAKEEKLILEQGDPPLAFRNFFPCPEPVYGTKATGSLVVTPDYRYYQDQAEEIDDLTQKISDLTSWLRLKGFYAGGPSSEGTDAIEEALKMEGNQILVKVESWAAFAEKGGVRGLIEWMPLDVMAKALNDAVVVRTQLINDVYQLTGISDILRGETDPNETLGAQQIKAQTGSRRQSTAQKDLARFARDLAEMVGEVIAEVFQPETMTAMSGLDLTTQPPPEMVMQVRQLIAATQQPQLPPPMGANGGAPPAPGQSPQPNPQIQQAQQQLQQLQQQFQQFQMNAEVLQILKDERTRGFRIEIETDSTIEPDEQAEKQARAEFIQTVGGFMREALPAVQTNPVLAPMAGQMLLFLVRGFRVGRELEDVIEQAMGQIAQTGQQPRQDPEMMKAEADAAAKQKEMEFKERSQQQDMAHKEQTHQQETEFRREEMAFEREKFVHEQAKGEQEMAMREREMEMTVAEKDADREMSREQHGQKMEMDRETQMAKIEADGKPKTAVQFDANDALAGLPDVIGKALAETQADITEALKAVAESQAATAEALAKMAGPKRIVRDPRSGQAMGVEPIEQRRNLQ